MALDPASIVWDYVVFVVFIAASTCLPLWSKVSKPTSKADYVFAAGGGVGMTAMMLSIARGTLGVRSFLGFPSELYYRGSAMWETLYGMVMAYPIVCFVFVPVYYSLGITSVYQYLDLRFKSRTVRCLASATFIWRQLLNLGVTVFTPCVALNTVIGIPYYASILGITVIGIIFTLMGGLKAAIKADVIQGLTMIFISLVIIIQGCVGVGGIKPVFDANVNNGRLKFFDFKWDLTARVDTLSAFVGQMFMSASLLGCQQNFVQRYCSMSSEKKVRKTLLFNIPVIVVLYSLSWTVGMVIYAMYKDCDPLTKGFTKKMDEILPFYVEDKFMFLPGLMGLFMGSLFNGALSLLVSNLNSLATVTWEDFVSQAPAFKGMKDRQQLTVIKILGAIYAIIIMGISFAVGLLSGVIESSMLVTSATSGPLLGVFLLAMLVPCANKKGAAAGVVVSHVVTTWMAIGHLMHGMKNPEILPLSVEGCTNTTFAPSITKPVVQWPLTVPPKEVNVNTTHYIQHFHDGLMSRAQDVSASPAVSPFYLVTYMYYAFIGTVVCVVVGVLVSLIFGSDETDLYDENLLHPAILRFSRLFPGKPRKYLNTEKRTAMTDVISKRVDSAADAKREVAEVDVSKIDVNNEVVDKKSVSTSNINNGKLEELAFEELSASNSRLFENYDAITRNDFKGNRKSLRKVTANVDSGQGIEAEVTRF